VSHESLYLHVYASRHLVEEPALPKAKEKALRQWSGSPRTNPQPQTAERAPGAHCKRLQVGHWECDTVIGAAHKQAIVTVAERKSGYAVMAKVLNKTSDLLGSAIIKALSRLMPGSRR
jgi:IS30 family transposase